MKNSEIAVDCFRDDYNCTQSVLTPFAEELGLDRDLAFKIACGFGAGMGRMQEVCGAVTGAFMVIGLKHGKAKKEDNHLKEKTYGLVKQFSENFKKINGTINCKELLGCDLNTVEGRARFKAENLVSTVCERCVRDSVDILEQLLRDL